MEKQPLLRKPRISFQWPQHLASLCGNLLSLSAGSVGGWSAPGIPHLQGNLGNMTIDPITPQEASWIGSIHLIGALIGALPAGKLADTVGRKTLLLSLTVPFVIGWFIITFGYGNVHLIFLGRFICGIPFGAAAVVLPMYNSEIAEDNERGIIGVYFDLLWCTGVLWAYITGAYFSFFWFTFSCAVIPIIFFMTFIFMPESPVYLLIKNKPVAAERALRWLRTGNDKNERIQAEIKKLIEFLNSVKSVEKTTKEKSAFSMNAFLKKITESTSSVAILIGVGLMTFQKLSGVSPVSYYTIDIFREAGSSVAPEKATIIVGLVAVLSSIISAILMDKLGRKFLLILSGLVMSLSLAGMAIYSFFKTEGIDLSAVAWMPVVFLCLLNVAYRFGFGPVPWLMTAEILPTEVKNWANSVIVCYSWLVHFLVVKIFPLAATKFNYEVVYGVFCISCLISIGFTVLLVPETKCKSFLEIRTELEKKCNYLTFSDNSR